MSRKEVYGKNFRKAKGMAIARSGGKCQLCGIRNAQEGHHWAWPIYPSDDEVQGHDITALCKPCHEFATLLRNWTKRKGVDFDTLATNLDTAKNLYQKRRIFSHWLFPEDQEKLKRTLHSTVQTRPPPPSRTPRKYKSRHDKLPEVYNWLFAMLIFILILVVFAVLSAP